MSGSSGSSKGRRDGRTPSRQPHAEPRRSPSSPEAQLEDLAQSIPGAIFRFRCTPDGEYRLDHMSERFREITGLPADVDLTDFSTWLDRVPEAYVDSYLESIRRSREELIPWRHEWPIDVPAGRLWLEGVSQPHVDDDGSVVWNGLLLDVTNARHAREALNRAESDYRAIFDQTTEGIFRTSHEGRLLDANWPLVRLHRCSSKEELIGKIEDIATDWYVHAADRQRILGILDRDGYIEGFEAEVYRVGTGERFWSQENSRAIRDTDGNLLYYQGTVRDITADYRARRLAQRRGEILTMIAHDEPLTMVLCEITGTLEECHGRLTAAVLQLHDGVLQVEAAPALSTSCIDAIRDTAPSELGGTIAAAVHGDTASHSADAPDNALAEAMYATGYQDLLAVPVRDREGMVLGCLAVFAATPADLDEPPEFRTTLYEMAQIAAIALEQHWLGQRLIEQAQYDAVTGLPNRILLDDRLRQLINDADRRSHWVAVMLLDLDDFKRVNDSFGHEAGDSLLRAVAARLLECVRSPDTAARYGGDEFVVATPLPEPARATHVAERIIAALRPPFQIEGSEVSVRASIGVALFPRDARTPEGLLQAADTAMYAGKHADKNQYRYFDDSMNRRVSERVRIAAELRQALETDALALYYQPRMRLADRRVIGAEAQLRWHHPEHGVVLPGDFLHVAEESGLIRELDRYVVNAAARQVASWQAAGYGLLVSMNLSISEFQADGVGAWMARVLADSGVEPAGIEFRLAERDVMRDFDQVTRQLRDLSERAPGVRIALDDFGTGNSALQYLPQLPIDTIKIASGFVTNLGGSDECDAARAIARTLIELGHGLGLYVVAEGVETAKQGEVLQELGCNEAQGARVGQPMPATAFEQWMAAR